MAEYGEGSVFTRPLGAPMSHRCARSVGDGDAAKTTCTLAIANRSSDDWVRTLRGGSRIYESGVQIRCAARSRRCRDRDTEGVEKRGGEIETPKVSRGKWGRNVPSQPTRESGERRKLHQCGLGRSTSWKGFWCILTLKEPMRWQKISIFDTFMTQ